ncbi:unnamed protein product [Rotaria sp. Silwood1]|nr:unnamed protein product [Rotaria sp. Silwood1]
MNDLSSKYQCIRVLRYDSTINNEESVEINLSMKKKLIGKGTFAIVYKSYIENTKEFIAIKEIIVDHTHKNRELEILRELNHPNIIKLKYYFFKQKINNNNILCLIIELFPETIYSLIQRWHRKLNSSLIDINQIKLFTFQIFHALAYLHARGIAHRDIKPSNLLVNCQKGLLKICDFGTAKYLLPNDISVSYICSRYYRAPELIVGCTSYTTSIDIWAAACVLTEFYSGVPLFKGVYICIDQNDQLFRIILLLGEPNVDEIHDMKPKSDIIIHQYIQHKISLINKPKTIIEHLTSITKSDLVCVQFCLRLFRYSPNQRLTALYALNDKYYDEICQKKNL